MLIEQLRKAATSAIGGVSQALSGVPARVADPMAGVAQGTGGIVAHLRCLVLQPGALLLEAGGLGRQLLRHGRTSGCGAGAVIRATILPGHQPDQPDGGQQGRHRVGLHRIGKVVQELATTTFGIAQRRIDHLPGRQLALQCMDDVADLGTLLVDLTLQGARVFLRF